MGKTQIEQASGLVEATRLQADATSYPTQRNGEGQVAATARWPPPSPSTQPGPTAPGRSARIGRLPGSGHVGTPIPFLQTGY